MSAPFCNVALPIPLRTTFTYAVPEALRLAVQPGCRVLVPFRKKSFVGVAVERVSSPPADTKLREIARVIDLVPALTPKLLELGQWIASYYLAPIGEVFRSMLPPPTEISSHREVALTAAGLALAAEHAKNFLLAENAGDEAGALAELCKKGKAISLAAAVRLGISAELLQRLQRRGLLEIREIVRGRKQRTQRIVAWKGGHPPQKGEAEKLQRLRALLETERGPLPLPQLLKLARMSRPLVERWIRQGVLVWWEEPVDPAEDSRVRVRCDSRALRIG
jgi:primosomal protein N'